MAHKPDERRIAMPALPPLQLKPIEVDGGLLMSRQTSTDGDFRAVSPVTATKKKGQKRKTYNIKPCRAATRAKIVRMRADQAEMLFADEGIAEQLGITPGQYIRLCFSVNQPGVMIKVDDASDADIVFETFKQNVRAGMPMKEAAEQLAFSRPPNKLRLGGADVGHWAPTTLDDRRQW